MTPLSQDQIIKRAPSILTAEPIEEVSDKYSFVPTIDVINMIASKGWMPFDANQQLTRIKDRKPFVSHIVKFTMEQFFDHGEKERMDLILFNSHDKMSCFKLAIGIFRFVCANGLIVGDDAMSYKHKHVGLTEEKLLESVDQITTSGEKIGTRISEFKAIDLRPEEKIAYGKSAIKLLANKPEEEELYEPKDIIQSRRPEDDKGDLWNIYNRAQENIIKGGIKRKNRYKTRPVKSIHRDMRLNKALWTLTEEMAKLKRG